MKNFEILEFVGIDHKKLREENSMLLFKIIRAMDLARIDNTNQKEKLTSFMEFRDKIYWGENEITENEEIIDLYLNNDDVDKIRIEKTTVVRLNDGKVFEYIYTPDPELGAYSSMRKLVEYGFKPETLIEKSTVELNPTRFQII